MSKTPQNLGMTLFELLREMALEAVANDRPYGLRGWGEYYRNVAGVQIGDRDWETAITRCLVQRLWNAGFPAFAEVEYPHYVWGDVSKPRCDLVVGLNENDFAWIECKTAYCDYLPKTPGGPYEYDYSGVRPQGCSPEGGIREIYSDVIKLAGLRLPEAACAGLLLVVWDHDGNEQTPSHLSRALPSELSRWIPIHKQVLGMSWPDACAARASLGYRDRFFFWYRPTGAA
jgi:hypothetical protein